MRRWLIEKLGGRDTHEALTESVKHLFSMIDANDILKQNAQGWTFRGKPLTESEVKQLKDEANILRQMKLWQVLQDDIRFQANKKMFLESQTIDDLIAGKLLLYCLDIMTTRLNKM